jgi:hypothetical protein
MNKICYLINQIPDLTLNKYQGLESQGVNGLISIQEQFFNLLQNYSLMNNITFSIIYRFRKVEHKGKRLDIILEFIGNAEELEYLKKLIKSNIINVYYKLKVLDNNTKSLSKYEYCGVVTKREKYIKEFSDPFSNREFFQISSWKTNKENRYISLIKLLSILDDDFLIRCDFKTVDYFKELEETIANVNKNLMTNNHRYQEDSKNKTIRYNEDLLKSFNDSPQIKAHIYVLGNKVMDIKTIINSMCSEVLEKGDYKISMFSPGESDYLGEFVHWKYDQKEICIYKDLHDNINICSQKTLDINLGYLPTLFTLEEVSPFFRITILYENEVAEIPKETSSLLVVEKYNDVIDIAFDEENYKVSLPLNDLNKHMFICGIPGSGKTTTMHRILIELYNKQIPFLVFEPAKTEYRELIYQGLDRIILFSPKPCTQFELRVNPFEFPLGISLSEHISNLLSIFTGAFYFPTPTPMILEETMEKIYIERGWDLLEINLGNKMYPSMNDFYENISKIIDTKKYSAESKDNFSGICEIRIGNLLRREKKILFGSEYSTIRPEKWLHISSIIEMENLDSNTSNFLTLLLSTYIRETLKVELIQKQERPRHIILFEEAHNLITPNLEVDEESANIKVASTKYIIKMLAEVRALKEGIIIADQLPSAMAPEIVKNTSTKIIHKITANDELEKVSQTTNANSIQLESVSVFNKGEVLLDIESLIKPFKCCIMNVEGHAKTNMTDNELFTIYKEGKGYSVLKTFFAEAQEYKLILDLYNKYTKILNDYYQKVLQQYVVISNIKKVEKESIIEAKKLWKNYYSIAKNDKYGINNLYDKLMQLVKTLASDHVIYNSAKTILTKKCFTILGLLEEIFSILENVNWEE